MATESGCHRNRHWYSGFSWWAKRKSSTARLSVADRPRMRVVKARFTYSAFRPVTGWVRTTGWTASGKLPSRESSSFEP
jgi:hypothetical protein